MADIADTPSVLELEITLTGIAHGGESVGRTREGRVVFARHGIPGETVRVRIRGAEEKARLWRGEVFEVLQPSEHRVPHVWPLADVLIHEVVPGGADFGHMTLAHQRELKTQVVREQLARIGGIEVDASVFTGVLPPLQESTDGLGWRTRMAYGVDQNGHLAMRPARSHRLIPTPDMPLQHPGLQRLNLAAVNLKGLERVELAVSNTGEPPLILAVPGPTQNEALAAAQRIVEHVETHDATGGASVAMLGQVHGAASDGQGSVERLSGSTWVTQEAHGYHFRVTGEGFWQIHSSAAETLMSDVLHYANAQPGQTWYDLYAGAGLFSLALADAVGQTGRVVSIEGAPGTHADARHNAEGRSQIELLQARVEHALQQRAGRRSRGGPRSRSEAGDRRPAASGIVLDPPRAGAGRKAISAIVAMAPKRIVYVSCDPASFARDAAQLGRRGYRLASLTGRDLYPHTHHIETVALFKPQKTPH